MLQVSQRPLRGTAVDAELYVDRAAELERLSRSVRLGLNSLVLGERGSGKTSLLHQFGRRLSEQGSNVRFVEAGGATTLVELLDVLSGSIHGSHRDKMMERALSSMAGADWAAVDVGRLRPEDGEPAVLLLDSVGDPRLIHDLFGRLRDDVWQLPITWVVSGNSGDRSRYLAPPADAFFDAVIELHEFDIEEAAELLRRRAKAAPAGDPRAQTLIAAAAAIAAQVTPRTPRNLLAAVREMVLADEDPAQWIANQSALQWRASQIGRPAAMLLAELMDLAPISASDKRLLDRLGWTRGRAAQVFKQLEDAGLVTVTEETPTGPGRPRRLYAPLGYHAVEQAESPS